jgi:hypothetical protein
MSAKLQVGTSLMLTEPPVGSGTLQQPKQSQPFGVKSRQLVRHFVSCCIGQFMKPGSYGQSGAPGLAGSHFRLQRHPSLPEPLSPSKKQSCLQASLLSPGMPVANEPSSLSAEPVHSASAPSIVPSWSSSMQFVHWVVPQALPSAVPPEEPPALEPPALAPPALEPPALEPPALDPPLLVALDPALPADPSDVPALALEPADPELAPDP